MNIALAAATTSAAAYWFLFNHSLSFFYLLLLFFGFLMSCSYIVTIWSQLKLLVLLSLPLWFSILFGASAAAAALQKFYGVSFSWLYVCVRAYVNKPKHKRLCYLLHFPMFCELKIVRNRYSMFAHIDTYFSSIILP